MAVKVMVFMVIWVVLVARVIKVTEFTCMGSK